MRASTVHQPWASLTACKAKRFETRNYPPPANLIGQRIAIHASVRKPLSAVGDFVSMFGDDAVAACNSVFTALGGKSVHELPRSAVVATAVLAGAYQVKEITPDGWAIVGARHGASPPFGLFQVDHFGDYAPGRWCWYLTDVQALPEPVPAKGKQGWWEWSAAA